MAEAPAREARLSVTGAMQTDVGCVRKSNEDSVVFVNPAEGSPDARHGWLALVADGMGGHAAGEVASAIAAEVVRRVYFAFDGSPGEALRRAFEAANRAILDESLGNPQCEGMGTTCTALALRDGRLWLAHVGDSRAYLLRRGELHQLSDDQTLHARWVRDGIMTAEEAAQSPGGNVILQALGTRPEIEPSISEEGLPAAGGDILILCSDGLYNQVSEQEIAEVASNAAPLDACRRLVEAARANGGYDNISVGVFVVGPADDPAPPNDRAATRRIAVAKETDVEAQSLSHPEARS